MSIPKIFLRRQRRVARVPSVSDGATLREILIWVAVTLVFGIAIPVWQLVEAHASISLLGETLKKLDGYPLIAEFRALQPSLSKVDDYRLASQVIAESASQRAMVNKQVMKATAMQIGVATMSVGLMLVLLGVRERHSISVKFAGFALDLPQVTTGAMVFVAGGAIAGAAALMPNSYRTVGLPWYGNDAQAMATVISGQSQTALTGEAACRAHFAAKPDELANCLKEVEQAKAEQHRAATPLGADASCKLFFAAQPQALQACLNEVEHAKHDKTDK